MNTYNLLNLLDGEISLTETEPIKKINLSGIQIPIIQRDYAQGRTGEEVIRNRFLDALFDAVVQDTELQLDFIYGSIKQHEEGKNVFLPLDGQQRLTTLFLLYWYVGNRELEGDELETLRLKLGNFSYATRTTARTFCAEISKIGFSDEPAARILNAFWFHRRYQNDPTVTSMIRMINAIDIKYKEIHFPIFASLSKLCFYVLPLDGFNLTDELYIKMNARGKQLTGFENFKADLINWMKDAENPDSDIFHAETDLDDNVVSYYTSIASKIDNAWTDIFWSRAKIQEKTESKIVDTFFLAFINRYLLNEFIVSFPSDRKLLEVELDEHFKFLYDEDESRFRYQLFSPYADILNVGVIRRMEKVLDAMELHREVIEEAIAPAWPLSQRWSIFDVQISQTQRILFLGVCLYLQQNDFDKVMFSNWLRVLWNIISDPDIRSVGSMIGTMRIVKDLSAGSGDIYKFLKTVDSDTIGKSVNNNITLQIEEEAVKATLITDEQWTVQILKAEKHPLFHGNIRFLLEDRPTLIQFEHRLKIAEAFFNASGASEVIEQHGLLRFLISRLDSWSEVQRFNYSDTYGNWELILRRDSNARAVIRELTDLLDIDSVKLVIESALTKSSILNCENGHWEIYFQRAHTALYADIDFFNWRQAVGCNKVKQLHDHHFIVKPSAWYSKVMITTFRNEIISELNERLTLDLRNHRCGKSNYFWGESIEIFRRSDDYTVSFEFDNDSRLSVGIKKQYNPSFDFTTHYDDIWFQKIDFNFSDVQSHLQVLEFVDAVVKQVSVINADRNNYML